jgi:hypothetical protein
MTRASTQPPVIEVRPQANVYTVLVVVAILAMLVAVLLGLSKLMGAPPDGYGLNFDQLFGPVSQPPK